MEFSSIHSLNCNTTMFLKSNKVFALLVLVIIEAKASRILGIFPTPSISHQVVFRPLMHELAHRGHEVTVITPDPVFVKGEGPKNLTEIDVHDISYDNWEKILIHHTGRKEDIVNQMKTLLVTFSSTVDLQLESLEVKKAIQKDKKYYDLIFVEACNRVALGIAYVFDAPIILFSSFGTVSVQYGTLGAPTHLFLYPAPGAQRLYDLTLWEKVMQLYKYMLMGHAVYSTDDSDYALISKHFGHNVPSFDELGKSVKMLFLNEHPIWSDNRPVPPNILYLGGIHQSSRKEIPKDVKSFLDSSKAGVIYVSFGTNVIPSLLPREKIQIIVKVLSKLPYNILFKWDKEELPEQSKNIKTFKWIPQSDVLRHPNMKLFITQGGLQSTDEAIDAGVPVIGIPMLVDQWYNVEKYTYHKIGLQLDLETLNETDLKNAIDSVINDRSYKQNILRLRSLMRDYPIKPLDNAVWWSEHLIEFGGEHLKSPAANMSMIEYYEVKLILILSTILLSVLVILSLIIKAVLGSVFRRIIINNQLRKTGYKRILLSVLILVVISKINVNWLDGLRSL